MTSNQKGAPVDYKAGTFTADNAKMLLDIAKWVPRPMTIAGLPLLAPLPPGADDAAMNNQLQIEQLVSHHPDILGGMRFHFADLIMAGKINFIQFRIKPTMVPVAINVMMPEVRPLKEAFMIIMKSGIVVAMHEGPAMSIKL